MCLKCSCVRGSLSDVMCALVMEETPSRISMSVYGLIGERIGLGFDYFSQSFSLSYRPTEFAPPFYSAMPSSFILRHFLLPLCSLESSSLAHHYPIVKPSCPTFPLFALYSPFCYFTLMLMCIPISQYFILNSKLLLIDLIILAMFHFFLPADSFLA